MSAEQTGSRPGSVSALPAQGRRSDYLLELGREWVNDRFWFVPTALLALGALLALIVAELEYLVLPLRIERLLPVDPNAAGDILGIVATSMLTFVGVVFTITLVALQLASAQLSPRVIRTFVRSGVTKLAFGTFLAAFAYAIVALVLEGSLRNADSQSRAVTIALLLVLGSLCVFVVYVNSTMKLLQVHWVITAVANETRRAIDIGYPPAEAYIDAPTPAVSGDPVRIGLAGLSDRRYRRALGVVLGIDQSRLVRLAAAHDCVVELVPRIGQYVPTGATVLTQYGGSAINPDDILGTIHLGRSRTVHQDPAYGIRQLVDVASQALSPAINQPTTAVLVIDRLEDLVLRIAVRPEPSGCHTDQDGTVRLITHPPNWDQILDLAFTEITLYGSGSPQVPRRLLAAYDSLLRVVPVERRPALERRRASLIAAFEAMPALLSRIFLKPDPTGLG